MAPERAATGWARIGAIGAVLAVSLFAAAVRMRLLDLPLERDEGEYAYAGQLLLQGVPPYTLAYNMKFPGTYYAYAAILAVFGESVRGIRLGLLLVNAATTALVFLLGRRLFGNFAAAVAGCAFALLSLDRMLLGLFAHATHFVILPMLAGLLILPRDASPARLRLVASGVLLGTATLMKQHAVFFLPLAAALVARASLRERPGAWRGAGTRVGWLLAGAALPFAALAAVLTQHGLWERFWSWTFVQAAHYATEVPLAQGPPRFLEALGDVTSDDTRRIWLAALAGAVALVLRRDLRDARFFALGLLAASLAALVPGFRFRGHYFIVLLPAIALLVGVAADSLARLLGRVLPKPVPVLLAALACVALGEAYIAREHDYLLSLSPRDVSRRRYGISPFIESPEIARYIREHSEPDDRIAVVGSEPQIYFLANRRSATGYLYVYPMMRPGERAKAMQDEMIREIEAAHPAYLVVVQVAPSWLARRKSDARLVRWLAGYTRECYEPVGIADIHSRDETAYAWDADVAGYRPRSPNLVLTYRRRSEAPCAAPPEVAEPAAP